MSDDNTCPNCCESYEDNGGPVGTEKGLMCDLCFEGYMDARTDPDQSLDYDGSPLEFKCEGSALRAASESNPRNLPCPTCGGANRLTPKDKALGYQCDSCADAAERGYP
jgi:hypothetical protein